MLNVSSVCSAFLTQRFQRLKKKIHFLGTVSKCQSRLDLHDFIKPVVDVYQSLMLCGFVLKQTVSLTSADWSQQDSWIMIHIWCVLCWDSQFKAALYGFWEEIQTQIFYIYTTNEAIIL